MLNQLDLCRNDTATRQYHDSQVEVIQPTEAQKKAELDQLTKELFPHINDETVYAFNKCGYGWRNLENAITGTGKRFCQMSEKELMKAASEAYFFVQEMRSIFHESMKEVAEENAREKLRGQQ